ncbi:MAG TPA: zinc metallopeptidase [Anaerolineae bacterium]|nr:zinc metallopeptidase [Anaerolineae bacterium]HQI86690.1 zinc metallopeptidase [Anaerolineae bacterium]HQK13420.1 zinc metallopeptidase [Anaerolineae bacterium]
MGIPMYYVFGLPALILALYAQWRVTSTYNKYLRIPNSARMTGLQVAQYLMRATGLTLRIEGVGGQLTDHYDPRSKVLRLSSGVAQSGSVGAVAVVAHEIGHALQDAQAFALLRLRSGLVPVVNFTSWLGPIIFLVGMLFQSEPLAIVGVYFVAGAVVFALLTLPVELDASRRAMHLLEQSGILADEASLRGARKMLSAAALTYVAALAQAISTMLYYIFLLSGNRRRRS